MSDKFGMMALGTIQNQYLEGSYSMNCAQETFAAADREIAAILQRCHDEALELLRSNRDMLDAIASYLFKRETITGAQMMAILEGRDPDREEYYGVTPAKDSAIEPPARHISMTSEPIQMPAAPAGDAPGGGFPLRRPGGRTGIKRRLKSLAEFASADAKRVKSVFPGGLKRASSRRSRCGLRCKQAAGLFATPRRRRKTLFAKRASN